MENLKNATFFAKKIVEESRHKFINSYSNNRELLKQRILEMYPIRIDDRAFALYLELDGLPKISTIDTSLNKSAIATIADEYLSFSIASELIQSVINNNEANEIARIEYVLLDYINRFLGSTNIDKLQSLLQVLKETKNMYLEIYLNYLQKGSLENPFQKTIIPILDLERFVIFTKRMLGKNTHLSVILDNKNDIFIESYRAVNNLLASRINANISVNVLSEPDAWNSFVAQNGQFVEATHDYEDVTYDESSSEYIKKMRKKYE